MQIGHSTRLRFAAQVEQSRVRIPLRILRRFIHVKYVARVDLQNLLLHHAALRKEVAEEIERYLESLQR